jgi:predicted peptidase
MRKNLITTACLIGLTAFSTMKITAASTNEPALQPKTVRLSTGKKVNYLLFRPTDYVFDSTNRWPLILFLHGAGERGSDVWKAATHGPSKYIAQHPDFPFILVIPQCPEKERWSNEVLLGLLDEVTHNNKVDATRVYLTGLSMGGYGTWNLGTTYPEKFAAIAPICGGGEAISVLLTGYDGRSAEIKSLPVWAFHGAKDPVVPISESERMVKLMKDAGCKEVEFTVYPEAEHNCWTETYNNPKLYEWFLQHQRKPVK